MTHFERIKSMSEEEIAEKILTGISKDICDYCSCPASKCDGHCRIKAGMDIIIEYLEKDENEWLKGDE